MFIVGHTLAASGGLTTHPLGSWWGEIFDNYQAAVEKAETVNANIPHPVWEAYALMPLTDNAKEYLGR